MTNVKPCPFCGSDNLDFDPVSECIVCDGCGAFGPNPGSITDAQTREHAVSIWNQRASLPEPVPIPCEFPGCGRPADYEGWFRRRDPFLGTPTGHIVRIAFCESCKSHPFLCANEPRPEKKQ